MSDLYKNRPTVSVLSGGFAVVVIICGVMLSMAAMRAKDGDRPRLSASPQASPAAAVDVESAATRGVLAWVSGPVQTASQSAAQIEQAFEAVRGTGDRHVIVQFQRPLTPLERASLADAGVELGAYLSDNAFFAAIDFARLDVAAVPALRAVEPIDRDWKLHATILNGEIMPWAVVEPDPAAKTQRDATPTRPGTEESRSNDAAPIVGENPIVGAYILFHRDVPLDSVATSLVHSFGARIRSYLRTVNGLVIEVPFLNLYALADADPVQWIEPPLPPFEGLNAENRAITQVDQIQAAPYNLDGTGVTALVYDAGGALAGHVDFGGRVTQIDSTPVIAHATHTSGTVGGDGTASSGMFRGMAPNVTLLSAGFEWPGGNGFLYSDPGDIEIDYANAINNFAADISNDSIGNNTESNGFDCARQGDYGVTASVIDAIVRGSLSSGTPFRIVWSAGNERQGSRCDVEGFGDYYSTGPPAGGKNHITVGALNANDDSMTTFSSWGPVDDGRLKPDVSGPGCQVGGDNGVTSTSSSGGYTVFCGTSMSGPTICGIGALLLQDYRNQFPERPDFRNSTLKCFLAHTASDAGNVGPDYQFGYGSVRARDAVDLLRSGNHLENEIDQGGTFSILVAVDPVDTQLKVTIAWDDPPGTPNVNPVLVNDLDLRVFDSAGTEFFPWTLDPLAPAAPAVRTQGDHVNNIEQVVIDNPTPGVYRIEVTGFSVADGPQPFSLTATPLLINCAPAGITALDRDTYACESSAALSVVDCDLNTDDALVETVDVLIASDSEPAGEIVALSETGPQTAAFRSTIPVSETDAPGVLFVSPGDTITLTYIDADNGQGSQNVVVTDTAVVDCTPPIVSNVQVINIGPREATVTFDTDERATATVRYGTTCGALDNSVDGGLQTTHALRITGLQDNTTYFLAIDVADEAANAATDDNGGSCYSFGTPEIPDFFTEQFTGDFDLDFKSVTNMPDGSFDFYRACVEDITALPVDPAGAITLTLSDDSFAMISLTGGATVSLYGVSYSSAFVGSNGYLTFTAGDSGFTETPTNHFETPRVSALFDDLDPSSGGRVSWQQLTDRVVVTWENVPEFSATGANTMQVEMFFDGVVRISYAGVTSADSIVGLSAGSGLSPDFLEDDISLFGTCGPQVPLASDGTIRTLMNEPVAITLVAADDGLPNPPGALGYIVDTLPAGELRDASDAHLITPADLPYTLIDGGNTLVYTPAPVFIGSETFNFHANDGGAPPDGGDSRTATVTIHVDPILSAPFSDDFPATSFDTAKWRIVDGATIDTAAANPPTPPNAARINGIPGGGDELRTHVFDFRYEVKVLLSYSWERGGNGDSPEVGDDLFVEFRDAAGAWQLLAQHAGDGTNMTTFTLDQIVLPGAALHGRFQLRFRSVGSAEGDDWFVDNVSLTRVQPPITPGDLNRDGVIDLADLAVLLSDFGCTGGGCPGDVDFDGDTDLVDLSILLGNFGT